MERRMKAGGGRGRNWKVFGIGLIAVYLIAIAIAQAAFVTTDVRLFPPNSTLRSDGSAAESTRVMQNDASTDWQDMLAIAKSAGYVGYRVTIAQVAATGVDADVDTIHYLVRMTNDRVAIFVADSQKVAGSVSSNNKITHYFSFADTSVNASLNQMQVLARMATINSVDSLHTVKFRCTVQFLKEGGVPGATYGEGEIIRGRLTE